MDAESFLCLTQRPEDQAAARTLLSQAGILTGVFSDHKLTDTTLLICDGRDSIARLMMVLIINSQRLRLIEGFVPCPR